MERRELSPVVTEMKGFRQAGEGRGGLHDHEVIDVRGEGVGSDLQPIELRRQHEQIVDLSP